MAFDRQPLDKPPWARGPAGAQRSVRPPARKPLKQSPRGREVLRRVCLPLAVACLVLGVGLSLWPDRRPSLPPPRTPQAEAPSPGSPAPKTVDAPRRRAAALERNQTLLRVRAPAPPATKVDHRAEQARRLAAMEVDGRGPQFLNVHQIEMPPDGQPLSLLCLLREPLDEATEEAWRTAGLLNPEEGIANPYVRCVTAVNKEALEVLGDGRVEGVALELCPGRESTGAPGDTDTPP